MDSKETFKQRVGGDMDDAVETLSGAGERRGETETPESWRNTTTQERDTIVGHKLQEVNTLPREPTLDNVFLHS